MNNLLKLMMTCVLLLSVGAGCRRIDANDARRMSDQKLFERITKLQVARERKGLNGKNEQSYQSMVAVARERYPLWRPESHELPYLNPSKYQPRAVSEKSTPARSVSAPGATRSSKVPLGAGDGAVHSDPRRY